jgi:hypothetical protein
MKAISLLVFDMSKDDHFIHLRLHHVFTILQNCVAFVKLHATNTVDPQGIVILFPDTIQLYFFVILAVVDHLPTTIS